MLFGCMIELYNISQTPKKIETGGKRLKDKYVVAVKDVSVPRQICQGKVLDKYREKDFAFNDRQKLARRAECAYWQVGIFFNGKLIN